MQKHPELGLDHFTSHRITRVDARGRRKTREVYQPDEEAAARHELMLQALYDGGLVDNPWVMGGMPGRRLVDNVLPHVDNKSFYLLDLKDAFSSVNTSLLKKKLLDITTQPDQRAAYDEFMDVYATTYRTPGLPQGAPCSPYLFNFYCQEMDIQLGAFCADKGFTYTRWLDDFTISSPEVRGSLSESTRRLIREIIESTPGLRINHAKSRLHKKTDKPVTITGISLYPDGRIQPAPQLLDKLFKEFASIEASLIKDLDKADLDGFRSRLNGWNSVLVSMRNPDAEMTGILTRGRDMYHMLSSWIVSLNGEAET